MNGSSMLFNSNKQIPKKYLVTLPNEWSGAIAIYIRIKVSLDNSRPVIVLRNKMFKIFSSWERVNIGHFQVLSINSIYGGGIPKHFMSDDAV